MNVVFTVCHSLYKVHYQRVNVLSRISRRYSRRYVAGTIREYGTYIGVLEYLTGVQGYARIRYVCKLLIAQP